MERTLLLVPGVYAKAEVTDGLVPPGGLANLDERLLEGRVTRRLEVAVVDGEERAVTCSTRLRIVARVRMLQSIGRLAEVIRELTCFARVHVVEHAIMEFPFTESFEFIGGLSKENTAAVVWRIRVRERTRCPGLMYLPVVEVLVAKAHRIE